MAAGTYLYIVSRPAVSVYIQGSLQQLDSKSSRVSGELSQLLELDSLHERHRTCFT
mgnify:CR=1 FL=1